MRMLICFVVAALLVPAARGQQIMTTSPDGGRVASANKKSINVADTKSGKRLISIAAHQADVTALKYSPDGKILASCDGQGAVYAFDAATGKQLWKVTALRMSNTLEFSKNGKTLTVRSPTGLKKFDTASGKETK